MSSNYDNSASFYDPLSRLIFGKQLIKARQYLLPLIPAGAAVLVVGGGSGGVLEDIAQIHKEGLRITYVELSAKMMKLSTARKYGGNQVAFINEAIEVVDLSDGFDVIITSFFFDSLPPALLPEIFEHIHNSLKPGGLWLNTDFQLSGPWWQKLLLKTMYFFFKVTGCVDTTQLTDLRPYFSGYDLVNEIFFYGDFVFTRAYRKR